MSARPGRISEVVPVKLGARTDDTREAPAFYAAITQVREALRGRPVPAAADLAVDVEKAQGAL
jgi:NitT/TauT family transport system ATP-binding protein